MNIDINRVKILVTIPTEYVDVARQAVCEAGAGVIGNYSYCTSLIKSSGTFMPNEGANPYIGKEGKMEYVSGSTLEFICDVDKVRNVIIKLREVHPYEEPAIEIYPLIDEAVFFKDNIKVKEKTID